VSPPLPVYDGEAGMYADMCVCVAAYASFSNSTGSLTLGKRFDAVVWDDDLLTVPQEEMLEVRVKATIIDGTLVWGEIGV
jgi:predicted amidohydrolase YtcJ